MVLLAQILFGFSLLLAGLAVYGRGRLRRLGSLRPPEPARWPAVSVVVAARNEADSLGEAAESLARLDYPDLEVLVVDDRSDDGTPRVLAEAAARNPRLHPIRVNDLPPDWLGKTHALHVGFLRARGEFVVFVDADVVFLRADCLKLLVAEALSRGLDHFSCLPRLHSRSSACNGFIALFGMQFMLYFQPWRVPDPKSKAFVGVGALNAVRAESFRRAGGMEAIRLRPDDDVKLGKRMKLSGFRSELFTAAGEIRCEWHPSLASCLRGLEKSIFPGFDYSVAMAAVGLCGSFFNHGLPFVLAAAGGPAAPWAAGAAIVQLALVGWMARQGGLSPWNALWMPVAVVCLLWAIVRNTALVLARGGLDWRGTFYPLETLRRNTV